MNDELPRDESHAYANDQPLSGRSEVLILAFIAILAVARVIATYTVFSQVYDEPSHIAGGVQWFDRHAFTAFVPNPPLPMILFALGPYIDGARYVEGHPITSGNAVLYASDYTRTLSLARVGNLPFLILAIVVVWQLTRRVLGPASGLTAAALFALLPPILGNAGLATTDLAAVATIGLSILSLILWMDQPDLYRTAALGASLGLATVSKFSALFFFPLGALPFVASYFLLRGRAAPLRQLGFLRFVARIVLLLFVGSMLIWATYRFSWAPASSALELIVKDSPLTPAFRLIQRIGLPIPAPELVAGLSVLLEVNRLQYFPSYFMGTVSHSGHPFFYPAVLAVKTPIPFLLLALAGTVLIARNAKRFHWTASAFAPSAALMLLLSMSLKINTGIRHVMPIYLLLAVLAGAATVLLWKRSERWLRLLLGGLLLSMVYSSVAAHPDYLPYFNVLAGEHPERISITADLDWGQDLLRVEDAIERHKIRKLFLAYHGTALPYNHQFGAVIEPLPRGQKASGWIAISETLLHPIWTDGYMWLAPYEPVERIGKSMWLYKIP